MRPVWLPNLKKFVTGTTVSGNAALNVNVANTVATAIASFSYKERRFHDASLTTIPRESSNPVQLDVFGASTPSNLANTITEIGINWNGGSAIEILVGATAGAAVPVGAVGAGQTRSFGVALVSGNKAWVRAVQDVDVTVGELMVVFNG